MTPTPDTTGKPEARVIKFRAWDQINKRYIKNPFIAFDEYGTDAYEDQREWEDGIRRNCILEQFTGLFDCAGKEIHEGDIVEAWIDFGPGGEGKRRYAVKIGPFGTNLQDWTFKESGYAPEVIGNIMQNPELLKP